MTDTQLTIVIAAIPAAITSLAGLFASLRNGQRVKRIEQQTDGMTEKLEAAAFADGRRSKGRKISRPKGPEKPEQSGSGNQPT